MRLRIIRQCLDDKPDSRPNAKAVSNVLAEAQKCKNGAAKDEMLLIERAATDRASYNKFRKLKKMVFSDEVPVVFERRYEETETKKGCKFTAKRDEEGQLMTGVQVVLDCPLRYMIETQTLYRSIKYFEVSFERTKSGTQPSS